MVHDSVSRSDARTGPVVVASPIERSVRARPVSSVSSALNSTKPAKQRFPTMSAGSQSRESPQRSPYYPPAARGASAPGGFEQGVAAGVSEIAEALQPLFHDFAI